MTRQEVITKAIEGRITWAQAADILRLSARHVLRLRERFEQLGTDGLRDGRAAAPRQKRIKPKVVAEICRLKREKYADFSVQHFHEHLRERHDIDVGYTWTLRILQSAGIVEKTAGRGRYRRRRERRPMRGMLVHLDASTHVWVAGLPMRDLVVALDDADGRILFARFVEQEGTTSTMQALLHVVTHYGRFCELYTDRGSHFCRTEDAGEAPAEVQNGQVTRALKALGIRHIRARSPEARGRSERAFGTLQGRLPQELRLHRVRTYAAANEYLERTFVPDFNRRFTVTPTQPESAFTSAAGFELPLLLSTQHERTVRNDNTVVFEKLVLQLPTTRERTHFVRCAVLVHEMTDDTLAVSFQGRALARYTRDGERVSGRLEAAA